MTFPLTPVHSPRSPRVARKNPRHAPRGDQSRSRSVLIVSGSGSRRRRAAGEEPRLQRVRAEIPAAGCRRSARREDGAHGLRGIHRGDRAADEGRERGEAGGATREGGGEEERAGGAGQSRAEAERGEFTYIHTPPSQTLILASLSSL